MSMRCSTNLVLPIYYQPKQNQADSGTAKIKVNPNHLSKEMDHPVYMYLQLDRLLPPT